jgi:SOS-response transcriptional repressor LexA
MAEVLTEAQNKCFNFLARYEAEFRRSPSVREIATALGYRSTNAVAQVLDALEAKRYITRRKGMRGIDIIHRDEFAQLVGASQERLIAVPVMQLDVFQKGTKPLIQRGILYFTQFETGGKECFAMIAGDDGMDKSGILKGDLILVEKRSIAETEKGVLVGVSDGDDLAVREYRFVNGRVNLSAANRSYMEKIIKPSEPSSARVLGAVILAMRKYGKVS